jgi:hypothetical protein
VDVATFDERISVGSSFQVPIAVTPAQEALIKVQRAGSAIGVCCEYVDRSAHCSDNPQVFCLDNNQCAFGTCLSGCTESDFRFLLEKNLTKVGWFAGIGTAALGVPPVSEFPFVGELRCSGVAATKAGDFECPCSDPCNVGTCTVP